MKYKSYVIRFLDDKYLFYHFKNKKEAKKICETHFGKVASITKAKKLKHIKRGK